MTDLFQYNVRAMSSLKTHMKKTWGRVTEYQNYIKCMNIFSQE